MNNLFSKRLNEIKNTRNLKNKEIAAGVFKSESTVSHWLAGTKVPSIETLMILADFLEISPAYFVEENSSETSSLLIDGLSPDLVNALSLIVENLRIKNDGEK